MSPYLNRLVKLIDRLHLLVREFRLERLEQLIESLVALDPDDRRSDPGALDGPSERDLSHRSVTLLCDLLDFVVDAFVPGLFILT